MSSRLEAGNDTPLPDAQMLAWWALGFTPRVACLEDAVVLEWQASQRLFGGRRALMRQLEQGAEQAGCQGWGHARTALGALALARTSRPHPRQLDALPLTSLSALATHEATLSRMGCRTLGDVARLPRDGVSRRFGAAVLQALDQARSVAPEAFTWLSLPPVFDARLELPGRVDQADALQPACDWLLARLGAWLVARHMGVRSFTLRWQHDGQRRDAARSGEHTVRLGTATADVVRLRRLVAEHLRRLALLAPVGEISLHAADIAPVEACEDDLFLAHSQDVAWHADAWQTPAGRRHQHDALTALLERLSVRLGSERCAPDSCRMTIASGWTRPGCPGRHRAAHRHRTPRVSTMGCPIRPGCCPYPSPCIPNRTPADRCIRCTTGAWPCWLDPIGWTPAGGGWMRRTMRSGSLLPRAPPPVRSPSLLPAMTWDRASPRWPRETIFWPTAHGRVCCGCFARVPTPPGTRCPRLYGPCRPRRKPGSCMACLPEHRLRAPRP